MRKVQRHQAQGKTEGLGKAKGKGRTGQEASIRKSSEQNPIKLKH
jgi:hypothetical protein